MKPHHRELKIEDELREIEREIEQMRLDRIEEEARRAARKKAPEPWAGAQLLPGDED